MHENYDSFEQRLKRKYQFWDISCCEIGPGWYDLIEFMCYDIERVFKKRRKPIDFKPIQVKEKFGELRVYFDCNDRMRKEVQWVIDKYTDLSRSQCEICGEFAEMRDEGRIHPLCDQCFNKRGDQ